VKDPSGSDYVLDNWSGQYSNLGSGSDYAAFLQHLGIASVDLRFSNMSSGIYHSVYDSFHWMETFVDPEFSYHLAITQILGLVALRIADAHVLPYNYTSYAQRLRDYVVSLAEFIERENATSLVKIDSISNALDSFHEVSLKIEEEKQTYSYQSGPLALQKFNDRLVQTERKFLSKEGLPGRPWYKHTVQAPGLYTGYAFESFPGLTQAIRDKNWTLAVRQAELIAVHITDATATLAAPPATTPKKMTIQF